MKLARATILARKADDGLFRKTRNGRCPGGRTCADVCGELIGAIGITPQIVPVRKTFSKQHMHDGAGQRTIGTRTHRQMQIGLFSGAGTVRIDHHQTCAAFFCRHRMLNHIDLRIDRIATPDHDQICMLCGFQQIHTALAANARHPACVGQRNTNGGMPARVLHRMSESLYAIPLHQTHGASIKIRPDGFAAMLCSFFQHRLSGPIQRLFPRDSFPLLTALGAGAHQGVLQSIGMVLTLRIAGHFFADHAGGVGIALRAAHFADAAVIEDLDLQSAGAGAVVRADRGQGSRR